MGDYGSRAFFEGVEKQAIFEEKDLKKSVQPVEDT
jgi:hypothetical protein